MTPDSIAALQSTLESYFAAIALQKEAHPPSLIPHFKELDAWQQRFGPQAPPMLRHYLQNKSYQKALAFLKGEEAEA